MIVIDLPHFPFRGVRAPYLWMFYKALTSLPADTYYILHQDYLIDPKNWIEENRWEIHESTRRNLNFNIPLLSELENVNCSRIPNEIFDCQLAQFEWNPLKAFEKVLSDLVPTLSDFYFSEFENILKMGQIDAILSPINNPSLQQVARSKGIPLVHFELGPLRRPNYIDLAYFDFQGLNEKSEFEERFANFNKVVIPDNKTNLESVRAEYLVGNYWLSKPFAKTVKLDVGVSLQIEDDTNLLASSNGFSNQSLIAYSKLKYGGKHISYKAHPGSYFKIKSEYGGVEYSSGSDFIFDCNEILTINSSMGFEALLWGKQVQVLGHAAYKPITLINDRQERNRAISFYLTSYLVPFELIFNKKYINLRLKMPNEIEILNAHLKELLRVRVEEAKKLNHFVLERDSQIENLNQAVGDRDRRIVGLHQAVGERDSQIEGLNKAMGDRESQIESLSLMAGESDSRIENLIQTVGDRDSQIENLIQTVGDRESQIESLSLMVGERDSQIESLSLMVGERDSQIENLIQTVGDRESQIESLNQAVGQILNSLSWKITKPLRFFGRILRLEFKEAFAFVRRYHFFVVPKNILLYAFKVFRYLARGDISGVIERVRYFMREQSKTTIQKKIDKILPSAVCIVTPGHTNFVAKLIADRFTFHGWTSRVTNEMPLQFNDDLYIVICAQIYDKLPPGERLIIYQMEQSVSSRWFNKEYFKILENSLAVLEYSLKNINYLTTKGISYPHINYLPIGATKNYGVDVFPSDEKTEVLFYGDSLSSPRRQKMLAALSEYYKVEIVNNLFGDELISRLRAARVVINLHYYENALLEMPRIQECLSLGIHVVSESSHDQNEYPELDGAVIFFEEGSITGMVDAVRKALDDVSFDIEKSVSQSIAKFEFMFDRFLISMGFLPTSYVKKMQLPLPKGASIFGLSMPETIARRNLFLNIKPNDCIVFDGIRRKPGWIGCGLSYSALARYAKANKMSSIIVMEDDVILPNDFESKLNSINKFLFSRRGEWDVFSGVIAALNPEVDIIAVEDFEGQRFVTINKMTSTVFNIYAESAIEMFDNWNSDDLDAEKNTIDRYLENQKSIKVVATLPFLVGHREESHSTLWGFQNTTYVEMISNSQALLEMKVAAFMAK